MTAPTRRRAPALVVSALLVVSGCGGGATGSAEDGSGGEQSGGSKEFTIGFTTPGVSSVPLLEAIEQLNQQGYTIDAPTVGSSELAVEGVFRGRFAFSSGANNAVMLANQQGGNIQVLSQRVNNEWTIYAANDIQKCADLADRRVAIHSEGAVSTAMVRNYISNNCQGTEPSYLVIEGSQNRLAALLANEIDASPLELADAVIVEQQASDRYHLLASLAKQLPDLKTTSLYGNGEFIQNNPETVRALIRAQLEVHRKIAGDPAYLADLVLKHLPETNQETLDRVTQRYVELELFPVNGGLSEQSLQYTIDFFTEAIPELEPGLTVDDVADLSHLEAVLDEIGRQ